MIVEAAKNNEFDWWCVCGVVYELKANGPTSLILKMLLFQLQNEGGRRVLFQASLTITFAKGSRRYRVDVVITI